MGGDKYYRGQTVRRHRADFHAELEPTLSRHLDIEEDEIKTILLQQALRGKRIIQAYGMKISLPERGTDCFAGHDLVVDHQNLPRRHSFGSKIRSAVE